MSYYVRQKEVYHPTIVELRRIAKIMEEQKTYEGYVYPENGQLEFHKEKPKNYENTFVTWAMIMYAIHNFGKEGVHL